MHVRVAVGVLLLGPWAWGSVEATSRDDQCPNLVWTDETTLRGGQIPLEREYRGRVTFRTGGVCGAPVGATCADGSRSVNFSITSMPAYASGNFTPNPAVLSGSGMPFALNTAQTVIRLRIADPAQYGQPFSVRVRAECDGETAAVERSFQVGPQPHIQAHLSSLRVSGAVATWAVRVENTGQGPVTVLVAGNPSSGNGTWDHPAAVPLGTNASGDPEPPVQTFEARLAGYNRSLNYSLVLTPQATNNDCCIGPDVVLELRIVTFQGTTTPGVAAWAVFLAALLCARRRRAGA